MSDQSEGKTVLEKSRNLISQLKDMEHYSKTNIEKLSEIWLLLEEELKFKEFAGRVDNILSHQNKYHEELGALITDYETECNRIENEAD